MKHYLDHAATSAVRPQAVVEAVSSFLTECGATPGRGGHQWSIEAGRIALRCRRLLCRLLGIPGDPGRLAFMHNATHALNTALWGVLGTRDVVVLSPYAHNAVLRPLHYLARERDVELRMLSGDPEGHVDLEELDRLLEGASLLVVNAASNVLGTREPVREMAARAHARGALVLIDAAQSAGHLPVRLADDGADLIALTGHKGLLGPQGTGALWVREGVDVRPLITGGTGGDSTIRSMPDALPDRLEAGTHNSPGIAGLCAAVEFLEAEDLGSIHERETRLKELLREGLASVEGVRVLSPPAPDGVGIVTVAATAVDASTLARRLDTEFGVMTRAGIHCAPEVHRLLGTLETGAVRFSVGWCSTEEDVAAAIGGVEAICGKRAVPVS
jgi:cysteine desulfurase family protein